MKRSLLLAAIAVLAAACTTPYQDRVTYAGPADPHGAKGATGPADQPGYAPERRSGANGPAGVKVWSYAGTTGLFADGPAGQQGVARTVALWTTWCDFGFDHSEAGLPASEMEPISLIAAYLARNPSLEIGIDGSMSAGFSRGARDLSDRRAISVRDALLRAGVPAYKIRVGAFSNPDRRQEDAIQVLMRMRV